MSLLQVAVTTDFSSQDLTGTTAITFTNTGENAIAIFSADQLGTQIAYPTVITGSAGANTIVINGNLNGGADQLKFVNWGPEDHLVLNGTAGDDHLERPTVFATINAGDGNDFIQTSKAGGAVFAGDGNDTIYFQGSGLIDGGAGIDNIAIAAPRFGHVTIDISDGGGGRQIGGGTTVMNVESMTLNGGTGNDYAVGGNLTDLLIGGGGNDSLYGGGGNDFVLGGSGGHSVLNGGDGNDRISSGGIDQIDGGHGIDHLNLNVTGLSSGVSIDLVDGGGGRDIGDGTTIANIEQINFNGTLAADYVLGGAMGDLLLGNGGSDLLDGGGGRDSIDGGAGGDFLSGGAGADSLFGGADGDRLQGGTGADSLIGGSGPDSFVYMAVNESNSAGGIDVISDFTAGSDTIDLSNFHLAGHPGHFQFAFIGSAAFSHTAGELRFEFSGGNTLVTADTNGDGTADLQIILTGNINLTAGDFLL